MHKHTRRSALAAALLTLALAGAVAAQGLGPAVNWWVIAGGGGPAAGGNVTLDGTLGQPVAGPATGGDVALNAGYWQEDHRAASTVVFTSSANPSPLGGPLTLTATVSGVGDTPTGTVTFVDGATTLGTRTLSSGVATYDASGLSKGMHTLTAVYSGDASYGGTSAALEQAVGLSATTTAISAPAVTYDTAATVVVTVSSAGGTPTGNVSLSVDGGAPLSQALSATGSASFSLPVLDAGEHALAAAYPAQGDFAPSLATGTLRVHQATTRVTLTSSRNPAAPGDAVTFTAVVEAVAPGGGTPAGNVTFRDGSTDLATETLVAGTATLTTTALTPGDHSISAVYAGSANHAGSTSSALLQAIDEAQNPLPVLTSLSPASATAGGPGFFLTVRGSGFVPTSEVQWRGAAPPTVFVSASELTASISAADIAAVGTAQVTVASPAPGGGTSNALPFAVEPGALAITGLDPAEAGDGGAGFTLSVRGTGFDDTAVVQWDGAARTTTYISAGELEAEIATADIAAVGTVAVTVVQGSRTSNEYAFFTRAVTPTLSISALTPAQKTAGDAGFDLTVTGSGFAAGTAVYWGGAARPTIVDSASQLTAGISAAGIAAAGTVLVRAVSADEASNALAFTVNNPAPAITGLSPDAAAVGDGALLLTVRGTGFVATSQVRWQGTGGLTTSYVSAGELTAYIPAADLASAGTFAVTVANPAPGGGTSSPATFTVENPLPTVSGLVPSSVEAGRGDLALTVYGSGFVPGSAVRWDGTDRPTTYVSPGELTATIAASDLAAAGPAQVTVANPAPGGGNSNAQTFNIVNPLPALTRLEPARATVGGAAFTLSVYGSGFVAGSIVRWNGADRPTTYVSAGELRAGIPAGDVARAGTAQVTVANPAPGGGTSNGLRFTIRPRATPTPASAAIRLQVTLAPGAGVTWGELWAAVQWLDGAGAWHDVDGWQGGLEGDGQAWSVASSEFGKGPFRWALQRGQGGALLAVSDSFRLPTGPGQTVERSVTVLAPTPTTAATSQSATPPAGEPPAGSAGPAATPTATATATAAATPGATPTMAAVRPQPTAGGLVPVVQPEPEPGPRARAWPCAGPLMAAGVTLLALLLLGIAGGWLWRRRRQS